MNRVDGVLVLSGGVCWGAWSAERRWWQRGIGDVLARLGWLDCSGVQSPRELLAPGLGARVRKSRKEM